MLRQEAEKVVTHLVSVYPSDGDTPPPISWSKLANKLLDEAGPETTMSLMMVAAKENCLPRGTLDSKYDAI